MITNKWRLVVALFLAFTLLAAACGDDSNTTSETSDTTATTTTAPDAMSSDDQTTTTADAGTAMDEPETTTTMADAMADAMPEDEMSMPGEGRSVQMARGNWKETNFQNTVVQKLLIELGYEVSTPEEIAPATFFPALAQGDFDLWASTWPLNHDPLTTGELPGGGIIADQISRVGTMMSSGALQGLLVDISSVEQFGFSTLNEMLDNPEAVAHFDKDGNGRADINGCDDGWGCQKVINDTIAQNGWGDRIEQISATHAALFGESQASFEQGDPVLQYVWTPTAFVGQLVPGRDVLWLAVDPGSALEGQDGVSNLGASCTNDPCTTMFTPSDIVVTANNDWLDDNPAARALLENFVMDPVAVAVVAVGIETGANSQDDINNAADEWIANNRDVVDALLATARAAA